jgi:hypothetical protein
MQFIEVLRLSANYAAPVWVSIAAGSFRIFRTRRANVLGLYDFCRYRPLASLGTSSDSAEYPLVKSTRIFGKFSDSLASIPEPQAWA